MQSVYAVVMAGGRGERFWPLSTEERPKPFVPLVGPKTLLQETVERLQPLFPPERIFVAIGEAHRPLAVSQVPGIPPENLIVEPVGRDTAACLGWSALHLERRDSGAVMLALPADHFISDPECFRQTIRCAIDNLPGATGVVFGITPDRPETGYGYIRAEKPAVPSEAWPVVSFVEKPDAATAAAYLETGRYFWNSGMFLWRTRTLLDLFEKHMPDTSARLNRLRPMVGREERRDEIRELFSSMRRVSIDYGILERAAGLRLVPARFAVYIARSARMSRLRVSSFSASRMVMPTLLVTTTVRPSMVMGSLTARSSFSPACERSATLRRRGRTTTNSSPPIRAAVSTFRMWRRSLDAVTRSTWSPKACP